MIAGYGRALLALAAGGSLLLGSPSAGAEPLTPLAPNEVQYLEQLRRVFAVARDGAEFRGDGEMLDRGYYVCEQKESGLVGRPANLVSPIVNQLALVYLCPDRSP